MKTSIILAAVLLILVFASGFFLGVKMGMQQRPTPLRPQDPAARAILSSVLRMDSGSDSVHRATPGSLTICLSACNMRKAAAQIIVENAPTAIERYSADPAVQLDIASQVLLAFDSVEQKQVGEIAAKRAMELEGPRSAIALMLVSRLRYSAGNVAGSNDDMVLAWKKLAQHLQSTGSRDHVYYRTLAYYHYAIKGGGMETAVSPLGLASAEADLGREYKASFGQLKIDIEGIGNMPNRDPRLDFDEYVDE